MLIPYVGKFWSGKNWRIWQIVSHSPLFYSPIISLVILLATEVTKLLPSNSLNVSYSAYYSTSLPAILLARTDNKCFM